jgi:hypothetical protein
MKAAVVFMSGSTVSFIGGFLIREANQVLFHLAVCCHKNRSLYNRNVTQRQWRTLNILFRVHITVTQKLFTDSEGFVWKKEILILINIL